MTDFYCYTAAMAKIIEVGCAIIRAKRGEGAEARLLIAQRKHKDFLGGYWEFPGGKIECGETIEQCLVREIKEELGVQVKAAEFFCVREHAYPQKTVRLHFYFCDWVSGEPAALDCQDFRWIHPKEMKDYAFIPADTDIIEELIRDKQKYF